MKEINDILSDSIDILNIAVESQINYIKKLNNLYRTTAILFIAFTFVLGCMFLPLLNGSESKIKVICGYTIIVSTEIYILTSINFLRIEARCYALKLIKALENKEILSE